LSKKYLNQNRLITPSNSELKNLIEKALLRFENWKIEVNRNPNPKMVHQLKNILSVINSISQMSYDKVAFSYKMLSRKIAILNREVATLNLTIMDSLMDDDYIDEKEEQIINECLKNVIQCAVELIQIVQNAFGRSRPVLEDKTLKS
jgi:hypothetical protein